MFDHRLLKQRLAILPLEGNGPLVGAHNRRLAAVQPRESFAKGHRIAKRRRHEEETRPRERKERDLPGDATLAVE